MNVTHDVDLFHQKMTLQYLEVNIYLNFPLIHIQTYDVVPESYQLGS